MVTSPPLPTEKEEVSELRGELVRFGIHTDENSSECPRSLNTGSLSVLRLT